MEGVKITSREEFERWLDGKPRAWAVAMAARAALRALPALQVRLGRRRNVAEEIALSLAVFRAVLVLSAAATGPADVTAFTAAARAAAAANAASTASIAAATDAVGVAFAAAAANAAEAAANANAANTAFANAADTAAFAAAFAAAFTKADNADADAASWQAISSDAHALAASGVDHAVTALLQAPLWPQAAPPDWAHKCWTKLRDDRALRKAGFIPWFDWYEGLLPLSGATTTDRFGPALTRRIALQPKEWWDRGAEAVNADIAAWLAEQDAASDIPPQVPAAYRFRSEGERIGLAPPDPMATDLAAAQAFLDDLRERAAQAAQRLESAGNAVPFLAAEVSRLRDFLPATAVELNPFQLRSRLVTIDAAVETLQTAGPARELGDDPTMQVAALALAGRELMLCFPDLRTREREAIARAIPGQERQIAEALTRVSEAAANAPEVVTEQAAAALATMSTLTREAAEGPVDAQRERIVEQVMVHRNFFSGFTQFGRDLGSRVRPGILDGAEAVAKPAVIFTFVGLVGVLIDPMYTAPALLIGFGRTEAALKLVVEQLTKPVKELKKSAKKPKANE